MKKLLLEPILTTKLGVLYNNDCLIILKNLESESVDLIFADPPFNLGKNYGSNVNDLMKPEDYLDWCKQWINECARLLKSGGSFFIWNLPKWNIHLSNYLLESNLTFRHWIVVDIKYSMPIAGKLYPAHYSLLYFSKGKPSRFHRERLPIQLCRHCGKEIKDYGGYRSKIHPDGINLSDVWYDIPPVRHKSTKNRASNELSLKLMRRIINMASNPGDIVLDPFGGSGTTFAVCEEMHRHWIGVEIADCAPIISRLSI